MPTFLVTNRMAPELRARVQASVTGRPSASGPAPRVTMLLRLGSISVIAAALSWVWVSKQEATSALEAARAELLADFDRAVSGLTAEDKNLSSRVEPWLKQAALAYPGDHIAVELEKPEVVDALLKQPVVYFRAELAALKTPEIAAAVPLESVKDAFVLCLIDPPEARTEKAFLRRVRSAYSGGERMHKSTANVERLGAAYQILPLLSAEWRARVEGVPNMIELRALSRELDRAPLEAGKRAAKAALLLVAIDEPGEKEGPSELDGERPHYVRVQLIDLNAGKLLLRLRRRVDPRWLSDSTRAEYARGVDSCALGFDIRRVLAGT